jgi:hypothetical protein
VLALFDVDGTLTAPRKDVTPGMLEFMKQLREVSPRPSCSCCRFSHSHREITYCMCVRVVLCYFLGSRM